MTRLAIWRTMQTFLGLPIRSKAEYVSVAFLSLAAEAALRTQPLSRASKWFGVRLEPDPDPLTLKDDVELPTWAVRRVRVVQAVMIHWPIDGTCLRHSLVAGRRIRSLSPVLRLGVRKDAGQVSAHAWLEIDGRSLDPSSSKYATLEIPGVSP